VAKRLGETVGKQHLTTHGWYYDLKVKENIQNTCEHQGYEMKGCVAKNIKQVKGKIVKRMQKQGQTNGHGKTINKCRDRSKALTEDKKYIRSKKVMIKLYEKRMLTWIRSFLQKQGY
jgi:hypothetical protein